MAGAGGRNPFVQHLGEAALAFAANAAIACGQFLSVISIVKWVERHEEKKKEYRKR